MEIKIKQEALSVDCWNGKVMSSELSDSTPVCLAMGGQLLCALALESSTD